MTHSSSLFLRSAGLGLGRAFSRSTPHTPLHFLFDTTIARTHSEAADRLREHSHHHRHAILGF